MDWYAGEITVYKGLSVVHRTKDMPLKEASKLVPQLQAEYPGCTLIYTPRPMQLSL